MVNGRKATYVAEPLEAGFGLTLGYSLRRVLLSSLHGAAITSIWIEGVLHEFSSLAGMREDITDLVRNVKKLALRMEGDQPRRLTLSAIGPAEVTADKIAAVAGVEVMNPDLVLCHLDGGATLNMALTAETGRGYMPASADRAGAAPIGSIPIDALYSPVRQVSYKVENTRVGQELNYDKLTMTVETDGTISPDDAIAYAARILQDQLQLFVHFDESLGSAVETADREGAGAGDTDRHANRLNRYLLTKVDQLELSARGADYLRNENIIYIADLVQKTEAEMLRTPNLGRSAVGEIKEVLASMGLQLGMDLSLWRSEMADRKDYEPALEDLQEASLSDEGVDTATLARPRSDIREATAEIAAHAARVFGSRADADQWMHRSVSALGGKTPAKLIEEADGRDLVDEYLNRIDYGVYV